ncbi:hypothetical protein OEZ86_010938 [Tetradesmus obliquus]|nr:hypothetical protein OEZ86_010938 [Tetradesmus obliquus]
MPELPCRKELHQYFVTHALLDCAKLPEDDGVLAQPRSQQASSSSWQCSSLQAAYQAALLQYGDDPADLQHLIATYASAVLRVSQSLGSAAGQLLQQRAFSAADQRSRGLAGQRAAGDPASTGVPHLVLARSRGCYCAARQPGPCVQHVRCAVQL